MEWFRFYVDCLDNPKAQGLPGSLFKAWIGCLCLARLDDGALPAVDVIAFRLRCSVRQAQQWRADLVQRKLIDIIADGTHRMHDWNQHQYVSDGSTERVRKHREKQRLAVSGNVSVTPPDTDTDQNRSETDSETDSERQCASLAIHRVTHPRAADLDGQTSPQFEGLWKRWPRKEQRDRAFQDWLSYVTTDNEAAVVACADRYLASGEVDRGVVKQFFSWLEQQHRDGWTGEWPKKQRSVFEAAGERWK